MELLYGDSILNYFSRGSGVDRAVIDLQSLFVSERDRSVFDFKLEKFLNSHPANREIIDVKTDSIEYLTTSTVPDFSSSNPKLFMLFGNPAPHSVHAGGMFSSEGFQKEHRIWRFLSDTEVLKLD